MIQQIEAELKEISPWPWKDEPGSIWNIGGVRDRNGVLIVEGCDAVQQLLAQNKAFIIKSPERISALVEYVKAAEAVYHNSDGGYCDPELMDRFEAAREKLGLK